MENGADSTKERQRHSINTLLYSQAHSRVSGYAAARRKRARKHPSSEVLLTSSGAAQRYLDDCVTQ